MNNETQPHTAITAEVLSKIIAQYVDADEAAKVIRALQGMPEPAPETEPPTTWAAAFKDILGFLICAAAIVAIIWAQSH